MIWLARLMAIALLLVVPGLAQATGRFEVGLTPGASAGKAVTGRLIVVVASRDDAEPRQQLGLNGPPAFAVDVEDWTPGRTLTVGSDAASYPIDLGQLPAGEYRVQALLTRYMRYDRADGRRLWLPAAAVRDAGFAQPGNLYSRVQTVRLDPAAGFSVSLDLTETIPMPEAPKDTPWLKHVTIKSELLSRFWGRPIHLGATVLLPHGYDTHVRARFPAVYLLSHGEVPFGFSPEPLPPEAAAGAAAGNVEDGHSFYKAWTSPGFPRMAAIIVKQVSPYFPEAYAIDSPNNGPWGRAITEELIPFLEKRFRLIPSAHARLVEGASTGGWSALALQLHHPDRFGGAWVYNPDPVDFRHYGLVDIYKDDSFFSFRQSPYLVVPRPFRRTVEGQPQWTVAQLARFENMLGSKGRSGYQLDGWQSVHSPVGPDGYPAPLFDKSTGEIDRAVATAMRDRGYDLGAHLRRHWPTLAPKLRGKLNLIAGDMDWFYLNLAVYDFEATLRELGGPDYPARFVYGRPKKGHNWHHTSWAGMIREMAEQVARNAPAGEDMSSWRY